MGIFGCMFDSHVDDSLTIYMQVCTGCTPKVRGKILKKRYYKNGSSLDWRLLGWYPCDDKTLANVFEKLITLAIQSFLFLNMKNKFKKILHIF